MSENSTLTGGEMRPFWVSWYASKDVSYTLHTPWWVSGYRIHDDWDQPTICAAIMAVDEDHAKLRIDEAHDTGPNDLDFRFVEELGDRSPFNGRFPRADWMVWPEPTSAQGDLTQ